MSQIVKIETPSGEISLTPRIVRDYLVHGQGHVTDQEVMMFMALCKYQKLNPFLREAYLIKYGNNPATIVIGKDAYLKRARAIPECRGYAAGVICRCDDGTLMRTKGLCPPGCSLVGGWATVKVAGWDDPIELEVGLTEYLGRTRDGQITGMWRDKPATMIRKVALVQALREAFPSEFGGMYSQEEMVGDELPAEPITVQTSEEVRHDNDGSRVSQEKDSVRAGHDAGPQNPTQEAHGHAQNDKPSKRVRRNKFDVAPEVFGTSTLSTCGVTPTQLIVLKGLAEDRAIREAIKKAVMEITGYEQWSYLREDEAEALIARFDRPVNEAVKDVAGTTAAPSSPRLIKCDANNGDMMDVDRYCLSGACKFRARDGWCPILGEQPPVSDEEVF